MISTIQTVLNSEIPLTNAIGIKVDEYTGNAIKISAPLENNINHKNTAFGGSLYSVSVLAGWSLIYALLKENNLQGHIVIQESNIQYLNPVTGKIVAESQFMDELQINRFLKQYERKGIARIKLSSIIKQGAKNAVVFNGSYVVHL
ncbi:MAG: thioesterase domain-containing protein [Gammaproteobacteria bacterium]|nr:thioesterase domain-containing protein [Gammaproteobacteria bacterium]